MPGRQEARRKTPKKRVKFLMKTAVFEHPVKRYTIYWIFRNWRFHSIFNCFFRRFAASLLTPGMFGTQIMKWYDNFRVLTLRKRCQAGLQPPLKVTFQKNGKKYFFGEKIKVVQNHREHSLGSI